MSENIHGSCGIMEIIPRSLCFGGLKFKIELIQTKTSIFFSLDGNRFLQFASFGVGRQQAKLNMQAEKSEKHLLRVNVGSLWSNFEEIEI